MLFSKDDAVPPRHVHPPAKRGAPVRAASWAVEEICWDEKQARATTRGPGARGVMVYRTVP